MGHYARINDNNIVEEVIVVTKDVIDTGLKGDPTKWIKTSYNTHGGEHYDRNNRALPDGLPGLRKNYAGVGYKYDKDRDAFAHYAVDWLEETAGTVLGILPTREFALLEPEEDPRKAEIAPRVEELLIKRATARENKDWNQADQIRDELNSMGVIVTDSADGPTWDLQ